jgi:hypothetical protein
MKTAAVTLLWLCCAASGMAQHISKNVHTTSGAAAQDMLTRSSPITYAQVAFNATAMQQEVLNFCKQSLSELQDERSSLQVSSVRESKLGVHYTLQQLWNGIPVAGGEVKVNINRHGKLISLSNGLRSVADAVASANTPQVWVAVNGTLLPGTVQEAGGIRKIIHAEDGGLLWSEDLNKYFMPGDSVVQASVFFPDPLTTAQVAYGSPYIDSNDADVAVLNQERKTVQMKAWFDGNKFSLANKYFKLMEFSNPVIQPVTSLTPFFNYTRSQSGFEDVNAFYHLNVYHKHLDSLGYLSLINDTVLVDAHALGTSDQSMFSSYNGKPALFLGEGGVDDGEDADVIIHEYSHSIISKATDTDNLTNERMAIDEAICDYFAIAHSKRFSTYNWKKIFNWDGNNAAIQWTGRSAATTKMYPYNTSQNFYWNSEIFSGTLADLDDLIGSPTTEDLVLSSLSMMTRSATMRDMCRLMLDADSMLYNKQHWFPVQQAFLGRNIISSMVGVGRSSSADYFRIINTAGFTSGNGDVEIHHPSAHRLDVVVFDLFGREVLQRSAQSSVRIAPAELPSGMYIVQISSGNQQHVTRLLRH